MRHAIDPRRRDRASRSSTPRRSTGRPPSPSSTASRSSPTTPTAARRTSGSPTSARTSTSPVSSSAPASSVSSGAATSIIFIATPGQQNIQPRVDGALDAIRDSGGRSVSRSSRRGVDVEGRAQEDREDLPRAPERARPVRGRRRLDAGRRAGDAPAQAARARCAGGRLRPAAGDAAGDPRPARRLHDRPAAVPPGLPAGPAVLPLPLLRAAWSRRPTRTPGSTSSPARTSTRT